MDNKGLHNLVLNSDSNIFLLRVEFTISQRNIMYICRYYRMFTKISEENVLQNILSKIFKLKYVHCTRVL